MQRNVCNGFWTLKFYCDKIRIDLFRSLKLPASGRREAGDKNIINRESKERTVNKKIRTEAVDFLFDAILSLKSREECYTFFEDVCTINELLSLSQRFEVAKMLREQKTYLEIAEKTGASTATISRVNRSLNYGNDGYDMVFERLEQQEEA